MTHTRRRWRHRPTTCIADAAAWTLFTILTVGVLLGLCALLWAIA